jgi:hypothetical protein
MRTFRRRASAVIFLPGEDHTQCSTTKQNPANAAVLSELTLERISWNLEDLQITII